ncbi:MAG TPA: GYF domain-containing protein [Humisphaera sp.]
MKAYFVADGGQQRGPFPAEELSRQGVRPESLIWAEGMPNWVPAHSVPEVAATLGGASGPPAGYGAPAGHAPQAGFAPQGHPAAGYPPAGFAPPPGFQPGYGAITPQQKAEANSKKVTAGLCALLLGTLGIHKFVLGQTGAGMIMLLVSLLTCGMAAPIMHVIGLVEGIMYLTKSDEEFHQTYMVQGKSWF